MSVPQGTPGAESSVSEAPLDAASLPDSSAAVDAGGQFDASFDGDQGADASAEGFDPEAVAQAADEADLAQYPDELRNDEEFKSLKPATRKKFYEHAEANAREGLKAVQAREAKIATDEAAKQKVRDDLRAKLGKYVGDVEITKVGRDGIERTLPSFEETTRLNQNQRGRSELWQKYSLDEDGIEDHLENLTERRQMLDGSIEWQEDQALGRIDSRMRDGFRTVGLESLILEQAHAPEEIVPLVVKHLKAEHAAEMKQQKDHYEARLGAVNANAEGMRGRVLAASGRSPATGGRSGGGGGDMLTPEAYAALPSEERMKLRSTPEGRARIDAMTRGGRR